MEVSDASHTGRFNPGKNTLALNGHWVGPRAGWDTLGKWKFTFRCQKSNSGESFHYAD
jgi:hypothetical protein